MTPKRRKEDMASWAERNKAFIMAFLSLLVTIVLSSGYLLSDVIYLKAAASENKEAIVEECKRSQRVDNQRTSEVTEVRSDIGYLKEVIQEVKCSVKETNQKLDWLIQQQIRLGEARND